MRRVFDLLHHWAARTPDAVALTEDGCHTTWAELSREVDRWAQALVDRGVVRGDRVAVRARPTRAALTAYLATGSIGAVFQGLNPAHTEAELEHVLGDGRPALVVDLVDGRAVPVARALSLLVADLVPGDVDEARLAARRATVQGRDPALLVHTSGSTGLAKGALLPHDALVLAAQVQARRWGGPGLTTLCPFPVNHVASLSDIFGTALAAGGRTVLMERFDAADVLRLLVEERVTFWGVIPTAALLVTQVPGWDEADLSALEHCVWGGGAASSTLLRALRGKGLRPAGCYGSTETVGNVCFTDPECDDDDLLSRSLGRPDPAYEVRVDDTNGELLVRSPAPFLGYLDEPEATAEVLSSDGWLRTGDVVEALPDGTLSLVGRVREMFKSGGYNVYPREVELAIESVPGVRTAAVLPVPDALYGEVGHAFVVAPGCTPEQLVSAVRDRLASYKVPKRVTVVDDLPLLPVGKVDKHALRAQLLEVT